MTSAADDVPKDSAPRALTGKQRAYLRGRAHDLDPVVHVGRGGVTESVVAEVDEALGAHELIKVRLHAPDDKRALAAELAARAGASACGLVGHTVVLFRPRAEKSRFDLP